jgi:DNA-binding CsgD family transcriptional regulator
VALARRADINMPLGKPLLDTLDRMNCGGVVLAASGDVLRVNSSAKRILKEFGPHGDSDDFSHEQVRSAIKRLVRNSHHFKLGGDTWGNISRPDKRQLLVHAVQLEEESVAGPGCVVVLVDLESPPVVNQATLQSVFDLTAAEASLATDIITGKPLAEIADARAISIATARTQLASIFAKTRTRRQAELVALLTRISILP